MITHNTEVKTSEDSHSYTIMVDIDEESLKELGQWPWPRVVMASLVKKINLQNPAAIGFDIIFPEQDRTSPKMIESFYSDYFNIKNSIISLPEELQDNDMIFAQELYKSQSVMGVYLGNGNFGDCNLSSDFINENSKLNLIPYKNALCNTDVLQQSTKYSGVVNKNVDSDGVLRRMTLLHKYNDVLIPSLSLALISAIDSDIRVNDNNFKVLDHDIKSNLDSSFLLSFYPDSWYKKVSAKDILYGNVDPETLSGKIVLIGSSSIGLHDQLIRTNGVQTIGSKIHMTGIDNLLHNTIMVEPEYYENINISLSVIIILFLLYLLIISKDMYLVITVISSLSVYTFITIYMFNTGEYISPGYFYFPFIVNFLLISITFMIIDSYKKRLFTEELDRSHVALLDSMVHVAEVHDIETGAHILRTKKYIKLLAEHIYAQKNHPYRNQLSPIIIEMMYRTAPLHDVGKVGIPDSVLKKAGKLTFIEYEVMKTHPDLGRHIINNAINSYEENSFFVMAKNIAYTHHEKWDGSGYPEGLKAEEIPLEGRFMAVSDVYDALINVRVYKEAFSYEEAYDIMEKGRGTHFDPLLIDAFFEVKDQFRLIAESFSD